MTIKNRETDEILFFMTKHYIASLSKSTIKQKNMIKEDCFLLRLLMAPLGTIIALFLVPVESY